MEDEPTSKKLKTEDSLMPEEEFLRRNKARDPRVLPTHAVSRLVGGPVPPPLHSLTHLCCSHGFGFWDLGQLLEAREASEHMLDVGSAVSGPPGVNGHRGQQGDPAAQAAGLRYERASGHRRKSWRQFFISL